MEVFVEQSVVNSNIEKRKNITLILRFVVYACYIAIIALFFLFWISPLVTEGLIGFLINLAFYLFMMVPFVLTAIFITRYKNNRTAEYDYFIMGSIFRVVKVINRIKRKLLIEVEFSSIESIGRASSENYERYTSKKLIKKIAAFCDYGSEDDIVYLFFKKNNDEYLLHITPDDNMIMGLRRSVSRITVLDKSLSQGVKVNDIS